MFAFTEWIVAHAVVDLLQILESAAFFNPQDYNIAFRRELLSLAERTTDPNASEPIAAMHDFDWAGYIEHSLLRAGFRNDELQEHFHSIVIRLLVSPGKLFRGWEPSRHGLLDRRFKRSVWNAIKNIMEKIRNRGRRVTAVDPSLMAELQPSRQPYSAVVDKFRDLVADEIGELGVAILDQRLRGEDTKALVGQMELGRPSVWQVKQTVSAVKELAQRYAARIGGPDFADMVSTAMDREAATVSKRQAARKQECASFVDGWLG